MTEQEIRTSTIPSWDEWKIHMLKRMMVTRVPLAVDMNLAILVAQSDNEQLDRCRLLWWEVEKMSEHTNMSFDSFFAQPPHHRAGVMAGRGERLCHLFVLTNDELDSMLSFDGIRAFSAGRKGKGSRIQDFLKILGDAGLTYKLSSDHYGTIEVTGCRWEFWPIKGSWKKHIKKPVRSQLGLGAGELVKSVQRFQKNNK